MSSQSPLILGIESSDRTPSLAILRGEELLCETTLNGAGRRPAQSLFPALQHLLKSRRLTVHDLDRVAVSRGPGSFTGLRIGIVLAKTLGYATGCEVVPVDTFLAIASRTNTEKNVVVLRDAQRNGLFVGQYRRTEGGWQQFRAIGIRDRDLWTDGISEGAIVTGDGIDKSDPECLSPFQVADQSVWRANAAGIAKLALREEPVDPMSLVPFYLRRSAAEEKRTASSEGVQADPPV